MCVSLCMRKGVSVYDTVYEVERVCAWTTVYAQNFLLLAQTEEKLSADFPSHEDENVDEQHGMLRWDVGMLSHEVENVDEQHGIDLCTATGMSRRGMRHLWCTPA